jgi:superfamily II DNA helicase RecQ
MEPRNPQLRETQAETLGAVASGDDVLIIDKTGVGKSVAFQLPAVARWKAERNAENALPAVALLVVPFISLCEHQEAGMVAYMQMLYELGRLPRHGRALYVRRSHEGEDADAAARDDSAALIRQLL